MMRSKKMRRWGMGTLEVVMIVALAAIVGVAIYGTSKAVSTWSKTNVDTFIGDSEKIDEASQSGPSIGR